MLASYLFTDENIYIYTNDIEKLA